MCVFCSFCSYQIAASNVIHFFLKREGFCVIPRSHCVPFFLVILFCPPFFRPWLKAWCLCFLRLLEDSEESDSPPKKRSRKKKKRNKNRDRWENKCVCWCARDKNKSDSYLNLLTAQKVPPLLLDERKRSQKRRKRNGILGWITNVWMLNFL